MPQRPTSQRDGSPASPAPPRVWVEDDTMVRRWLRRQALDELDSLARELGRRAD